MLSLRSLQMTNMDGTALTAEVIVLQDFRWSRDMIAWNDLLLLLEGETVKLLAPKNHFSSDIVIEKDAPIFATSKSRIAYVGKFNASDERETELIAIRWNTAKNNFLILRKKILF